MGYVYVDQPKVKELVRRMRKAEPAAGPLAASVQKSVDRAATLGVVAPWYTPNPAGAPAGYAKDAMGTIHEIERRLAYLAAVQLLVGKGYQISSTWSFEDAPPPSEADIKSLVDRLKNVKDKGFDFTCCSDYGPAEIDAAMAALSDEDLAALQAYLADQGRNCAAGLSNFLFAGAGETQIARWHEKVPALEPKTKGDRGYSQVTIGLDGEDFNWQDVSQGQLGDCWFLAALQATAVKNPDFLKKHIRQNANGTYTVTLYANGKPIEVTVSGYLPNPPYGGSLDGQGAKIATWVSLYEKAAAQLLGGGSYEGIESGMGGTGLEAVTGLDSNLDIAKPSLEEIEAKIAAGEPQVVSTDFTANWWLIGRDDLVPMHVYVVVEVVTIKGVKKIHLRNPWGTSSDGKAIDLYLTQQEYWDHFVSYNNTTKP